MDPMDDKSLDNGTPLVPTPNATLGRRLLDNSRDGALFPVVGTGIRLQSPLIKGAYIGAGPKREYAAPSSRHEACRLKSAFGQERSLDQVVLAVPKDV